MKKVTFILLAVLLVLVSCSQANTGFGTVSFNTETARGIVASITYPEIYDKTWTVTAEKIDGGASDGAGVYDDVLLTDTLDGFAVGQWRFTLEGFSGQQKVFEGSSTTIIKVGNNTVDVVLHTTADGGSLSLENCNFKMSEKGAVTKVLLVVDNEDAKSWTYMQMTTEDNDLYFIPTFTKSLTKGVHSMHLRWVFESGDIVNDEDILFRVDNGAVTHITIGLTDGQTGFNVTLEKVEPLANEEP